MQRLLRLAAVSSATAIVLGACGGSDAGVVPTTAVTTTTIQPDLTDDLFQEVDPADAPAADTEPAGTDVPVGTDTVDDAPTATDPVEPAPDSAPSSDVPTSDAPVVTTGTANRGGGSDTDPTVNPPGSAGSALCVGASEVADSLLLLDEIEFDPGSSDEEVRLALLDTAAALDELSAATSGEVAADAALIADGFEAEASGGRFGEDLTPEQEELLSSDAYFDSFDRLDAVVFAECGVELT